MRITILIIGGALYVALMTMEVLSGWHPAIGFIGLMFLPSLVYWLMYVPEFWRQTLKRAWRNYYSVKASASSVHREEHTAERITPLPTSGMSLSEACDILGVSRDSSAEEIVQAHRLLLKKNHPDLGGSTHLAKLINEAKTILMKQTHLQG